jgi:hypothetical protein
MTWTRTHLALIALLVVQGLLIAAFNWPGTGRRAVTETRTWLTELEPEKVERIVIEDDQDQQLELARDEGGWVLTDRDGYPADGAKVQDLLDQLAEIKVRAPVVQKEKFHESLGVTGEGFRHHVTLWGADVDAPMTELFVGTSPQYQIHHARRGGDDAVYEITGLSAADLRAEPGDWAETTLVDVSPDRVVRFTVSNEHGELAFERGEEGGWRLAGPGDGAGVKLDQDAVGGLVSDAVGLDAAKPVGVVDEAAQGFDPPAARVELLVERPASDGAEVGGEDRAEADVEDVGEDERTGETRQETVVIRVGAEHESETSQRYVTASSSSFAATVWSSSVQDLMDAKLELLVEQDAAEDEEER